MNVWAIVPIKPLARAKSRLADELTSEQRIRLATNLLLRTVGLLLPLPQINGVLVISRDTKALAMVRDLGAQTVQESGSPDLNNAVLRAAQVIRAWGADAVLVVPADIPLLAPEDIENVVRLGHYSRTVVIAPDRHGLGTNLLLAHPPGLITYTFGEDSFAAHQRLAEEAGASVEIYRSERVALDMDRPGDLKRYYQLAKSLGEPVVSFAIDPTDSGEWLITGEPSL